MHLPLHLKSWTSWTCGTCIVFVAVRADTLARTRLAAERGILIDGQPSTPGTLNAWLRNNGGYVPGTDDFEESAAQAIDPTHIRWTNSSSHRSNDLPWSAVISLVDSHAAVVINVMHGEHFVLVVGYDKRVGGDTLYVNDPGFNRPSYSYAKDVVGRLRHYVCAN